MCDWMTFISLMFNWTACSQKILQINGKFTELSHKFRGMDSILTFLRYETTSLAQIKGRKYTFVMNVVRQGKCIS